MFKGPVMFGMEIMQNFTNGSSDSYSGVGYEMRLLAKDSPDHRPSNLISLTSEEYDRSQVSVTPLPLQVDAISSGTSQFNLIL